MVRNYIFVVKNDVELMWQRRECGFGDTTPFNFIEHVFQKLIKYKNVKND